MFADNFGSEIQEIEVEVLSTHEDGTPKVACHPKVHIVKDDVLYITSTYDHGIVLEYFPLEL